MNRHIAKLTLAAFAASLAIAPAAAQNLPPPGNVNPGSMESGAEPSGAPNQPRSPGRYQYYGYGAYAPDAYGAYATPYGYGTRRGPAWHGPYQPY